MKKLSPLFILYIAALTSCGISQSPESNNQAPWIQIDTNTGIIEEKPISNFTEENINKIHTLEEIQSLNPAMANSAAKNHPKFIELQKDKMLLSIALWKIRDPEYLKLTQDQSDIFQGKEIWTPELKKIDEEFTSIISRNPQSWSGEIMDIINKKNKALQELHGSAEYKSYISANQEKLLAIKSEMEKYLTPEILNLQNAIATLDNEVYQVPSK